MVTSNLSGENRDIVENNERLICDNRIIDNSRNSTQNQLNLNRLENFDEEPMSFVEVSNEQNISLQQQTSPIDHQRNSIISNQNVSDITDVIEQSNSRVKTKFQKYLIMFF